MSQTLLETPAGSPAGTRSPAVLIEGLRKTFGEVEAVRGIDLRVERNELFGFLGPNGAGKSTTIKILCTLLRPTSGRAEVVGLDVERQRSEVRRQIGLVFQESTLDTYLSAEQNLRFHADVYGMAKSQVGPRMDAVLEMVGLADRRKSVVGTFSGGMKRRLEIARGLLHSPRVLFLDEPTIGLDPESRASLWTYVDELRRSEDITVFLTTHYMDEAERCGRIAIVDQGIVGALGTPAELKASVGTDQVTLGTADDDLAESLLRKEFPNLRIDRGRTGIVLHTPDGDAFVPRLFSPELTAAGLTVRSVTVARPSLDDVFLAFSGARLAERQAAATPKKGPGGPR